LWFDYGETLFEYGFYQGAQKAIEKSIELIPDWAEPYYTRAKIFFLLRKTEDALASLLKSIALDPSKKETFEKDFAPLNLSQILT